MSGPQMDNVAGAYPLTSLQQGMLYHVVTGSDPGTYVNQATYDVTGDLDVEAFRRTWDAIIERHAALRTSFVWDGVDRPLQVVHERVELSWDVVDLRSHDHEERERELEHRLERDREENLDTTRAPLMRMQLARLTEDRWSWTWTCHHLIADAWSAQIILAEVRARYARLVGGVEHDEWDDPPPFAEFVARQPDADDPTLEAHWRSRLAGFVEPHRFDAPGLPPAPGTAGFRTVSAAVDSRTTAAIEQLSRTHRVTMASIIVATWGLVVSRWMRTDDVVFGITSSGRDPSVPGIGEAVGLYINTVPCRISVDASQRVGEWLPTVQEAVMDTIRHDQTPLTSIQRWSDVPPGDPLFESIVVVENVPAQPDGEESITIRPVDFTEHSNYPIAVLATPGNQLELRIVHDASLVSSEAAQSALQQLTTAIATIATAPDTVVSGIPLVTNPEVEQLTTLALGGVLVADERTVHGVIEEQARSEPDAVAVLTSKDSISYQDLNERANAVANDLVARGIEPGDLVGIHIRRSIEAITAFLAVLKAGAAYVPLDPAYPVDHIAGLVASSDIRFVLTTTPDGSLLPSGVDAIHIDTTAGRDRDGPAVAVGSDDVAYVIHTSGSTGVPKGVAITHRNLVRSTMARPAHYGDPVGRFLLLSSLSFDSSVAGIYWSLFTGGTLVLPAAGDEHDIEAIISHIHDMSITHMLCLPALYRLILAEAPERALQSLQVAIVAGEASPPQLHDEHRQRVPWAELHNEYGPTESTVWCSVYKAGQSDVAGPIPIGRPIAGTAVHLTDRYGNLVPLGFPGEILVSGGSVSPGYLHRPDLTAERFVDLPEIGRCYRTGDLAAYGPDGTLTFLGRADHQLKIRGHRIEPSAVEASIADDEDVSQCAVVAIPAAHDGDQLVAYVTSPHSAVDVAELRSRLRGSLPAFMVPDRIVALDGLPTLPNGKVDRSALPDPTEASAAQQQRVPPRTETEHALADIWAALLQRAEVGITDDFFALGGDSIISIQMISRARQAGIPLMPGVVATHPTIADLAESIEHGTLPLSDTGPVSGPVPLGPIQRWFLDEMIDSHDQWNLTLAFAVPRDLDQQALRAALASVVGHHDMLRARFERRDDEWVQTVEDHANFPLDVQVVSRGERDRAIEHAQADLDLEHGPLARAVLLRTDDDDDDLLVVVVHHLVIDVVSWTILVDDLEAAYRQALNDDGIRLPQRTSSYRDWVSYLTSRDWTIERAFWLRFLSNVPDSDEPHSFGREVDSANHTTSVDRRTTEALMGPANEAYSTRPDELLTAAVSLAVADLLDADHTSLGIEGHGRPAGINGIDLTRTAGWFTAQYPIPVERRNDDDAIKAIKDTMRSVPDGGIGFGVLRDLLEDPEIRSIARPTVNLNYIGRGIPSTGDPVFHWIEGDQAGSRHPEARLPFPIEVVASIRDGQLHLDCRYDTRSFQRERVVRFATTAVENLKRLIDHCLTDGVGGFTPSDFPEVGLDQAQLDDLLAEL